MINSHYQNFNREDSDFVQEPFKNIMNPILNDESLQDILNVISNLKQEKNNFKKSKEDSIQWIGAEQFKKHSKSYISSEDSSSETYEDNEYDEEE